MSSLTGYVILWSTVIPILSTIYYSDQPVTYSCIKSMLAFLLKCVLIFSYLEVMQESLPKTAYHIRNICSNIHWQENQAGQKYLGFSLLTQIVKFCEKQILMLLKAHDCVKIRKRGNKFY